MMRIREPLRRFLNIRSISFRLYLIIVPTTILAILLISYVDSKVVAILLDSMVTDSTRKVAEQLASDLARIQPPPEQDALHVWLAELVETNSYITRIEVFRLENRILRLICSSSESSAQPAMIDETTAVQQVVIRIVPQFHDRERTLRVICPVLTPGGAATGCVTVSSSLHHTDIVTAVHRKIDLFLIPASVLSLLLMLHYFFTRGLTGRIHRLGDAMTRVRGGSLNGRAPVDRQDELGVIATLFNETMGEIEQASRERDLLIEKQKDFNDRLQEKVLEATRELSSVNLQLSRLNQDLMETQRRSNQYERMAVAGQMAAAFAHEIGSPLSAISTQLELMTEEPTCSDQARRRIQIIQDQIRRITGFVEEMLTETRAATQARARVQLNDIFKQLQLLLAQHLERNQIRMEMRLEPALPEIEATPHQLQQVFLNLLNNAAEAMPQGGSVRIQTRTETDAQGLQWVVAAVADDGVGIAREEQGQIFQPFFSTKGLRQGTGLGLSIAAGIVRQHGGTIELVSELGKGSTFTVRFPVQGNFPGILQEAGNS